VTLPVKQELEDKNRHTAKRLTIDSVNFDDEREMDAFSDQVIDTGIERVRAEGDELRRKGLMDEQGTSCWTSSRPI